MPLAHRVAWSLATAGFRGASRYWWLAERVAPMPPPGLRTLPDGCLLAFDADDYTALNLYRGLYERPELAVMRYLAGPGDTVIDVGANIGGLAARFAAQVGVNGRVVALEPSPRCLPALAALSEALSQIEVHAVAAGSASGEATLRKHDRDGHAGVGTLRTGVGGPGQAVRLVRLDDLVSVGEVALLKLDVEGFEPEVIEGGRSVVERSRFVLAEVSPEFDTAGWWGDLLDELGGSRRAFAIVEVGRLRARPMLVPVDGAAVRRRPTQFNLLLARPDAVGALMRFIRS